MQLGSAIKSVSATTPVLGGEVVAAPGPAAVSINTSPNKQAVSLLYDTNVVETGPGVVNDSLNVARILVDIETPESRRAAGMVVSLSGFATLDSLVRAKVVANLNGVTQVVDFEGPMTADFRRTMFAPIAQPLEADGATSVRAVLEFVASVFSPSRNTRGLVNITSVDIQMVFAPTDEDTVPEEPPQEGEPQQDAPKGNPPTSCP